MRAVGAVLLARAIRPDRWRPRCNRVTRDNWAEVGPVRVCAVVEVNPGLTTRLRVSFFGSALSVLDAAEQLAEFTAACFEFVPNTEWFVEIDARRWIHFSRPYTKRYLQG